MKRINFQIEKNYKVEMKNNKIILLDKVNDPNLKERIENFKFLDNMQILRIWKITTMAMCQ